MVSTVASSNTLVFNNRINGIQDRLLIFSYVQYGFVTQNTILIKCHHNFINVNVHVHLIQHKISFTST